MREKDIYRTKVIQVKETIDLYEKGDVVEYAWPSNNGNKIYKAIVLRDQNEDEDDVCVRQIHDGATEYWLVESIRLVGSIGKNFKVND